MLPKASINPLLSGSEWIDVPKLSENPIKCKLHSSHIIFFPKQSKVGAFKFFQDPP